MGVQFCICLWVTNCDFRLTYWKLLSEVLICPLAWFWSCMLPIGILNRVLLPPYHISFPRQLMKSDFLLLHQICFTSSCEWLIILYLSIMKYILKLKVLYNFEAQIPHFLHSYTGSHPWKPCQSSEWINVVICWRYNV